MTIEEAIDILENAMFLGRDMDDFNEAMVIVIEALKQNRWIPVSEKLPSDCNCDWVLAQIQEDNGYLWIPQVMEYRKEKDDWLSEDEHLGWLKNHNGAFKVVAWMPLPQPYKPESEE